eukprot:gene7736-15822_t
MEEDVRDEIESLKAIYLNDFEDRPSGAWEIPCFIIRIRPMASEEIYCFVTLSFSLPKTYPKTSPTISIEESKGLSDKDKNTLLALLTDLADKNRCKVMIYELTMLAQNYVGSKNKKPQTLNEEMKSRQKREEEIMKNLREHSSEKLAEIEKISQQLDSKQFSNSLRNPLVLNLTHKSRSLKTDDNEESIINIVTRIREEGHSEDDSHSISSDDNEVIDPESTGSRYRMEFIEICRLGSGAFGEVWKVKNRLDRRSYAIKKIQLDPTDAVLNRKIRREVTTISRLLHKHIVRYYAAWLEQSDNNNNKSKKSLNTLYTSEEPTSSDSEDDTNHNNHESEIEIVTRRNIKLNGNTEAFFPFSNEDWLNPTATATATTTTKTKTTHHNEVSSDSKSASESDSDSYDFDPDDELNDQGFWEPYSSESSPVVEGLKASGSLLDLALPPSIRSSDETASRARARAVTRSRNKNNKNNNEDNNSDEEDGDGIDFSPTSGRQLFIQMEYCHTTLRALIDEGTLWTLMSQVQVLLRQLVEALAYIHSRGVIHRDLKVRQHNGKGHIKIGDFGLAIFGPQQHKDDYDERNNNHNHNHNNITSPMTPHVNTHVWDKSNTDDHFSFSDDMGQQGGGAAAGDGNRDRDRDRDRESLTVGIGTAMYRAPEIESKTKSDDKMSYGPKADMFSLGVIVFEMCHAPFPTVMERIETLRALRERAIIPSEFSARVPDKICSIISQLVVRNPSQRPSAANLLNSSLIPPRLDSDNLYLQEVKEALSVPHSEAAREIVSTLFTQTEPATEEQEHSFFYRALAAQLTSLQPHTICEIPSSTTKGIQNQVQVQSTIENERILNLLQVKNATMKILINIFENHGACRLSPCVLSPQLKSKMKIDHTHNHTHGVKNEHNHNHNHNHSLATASSSPSSFMSTFPSTTTATAAAADYVDPSGLLISLPTDLISPFAYYASKLTITSSHRYDIDHIYHRYGKHRGHPIQSLEAVYDIIKEGEHDCEHERPPGMSPLNMNMKTNNDMSDKAHSSSESSGGTNSSTSSSSSVTTRSFVEIEILNVIYRTISTLSPSLPGVNLVLRLSDEKLTNSILELLCGGCTPTVRCKVLSVLSHAASLSLSNESTRLSEELSRTPGLGVGLNDVEVKALRGIVRAVGTQNHNPLAALGEIEQCINRLEVVQKVKKQIFQTILSSSDSFGHSTDRDNSKPGVAVAVGKAVVVASKAAVVSHNVKGVTVASHPKTGQGQGPLSTAIDNSDQPFSRKELRRYRMLLRTFDESLSQLRETLVLFSSLQKTASSISNSHSSTASCSNTNTNCSSSSMGTKSNTNNNANISTSSSSSMDYFSVSPSKAITTTNITRESSSSSSNILLPMILDLGLSPSTDIASCSPFGAGLYFRIETNPTIKNIDEKGPGPGQGPGPGRKLARGSPKTVAEGGHFEHLLHFSRVHSGVIACGLRIFIDVISNTFILASRSRKLVTGSSSSAPPPSLLSEISRPDVIVIPSEKDRNAGIIPTDVLRILSLLRSAGLCVTSSLSQLQGGKPGLVPLEQLIHTCAVASIPFVLIVPPRVPGRGTGSGSSNNNALSVKSVKIISTNDINADDVNVPVTDITDYLLSRLSNRHQNEIEDNCKDNDNTNSNNSNATFSHSNQMRVGSWSKDFIAPESANQPSTNKDKRGGPDKMKLKKKVSAFLQNVLHSEPQPHSQLPVVSSDAPYADLRELGTVLTRIGSSTSSATAPAAAARDDIERVMDAHPIHRKALKQVVYEITQRATNEIASPVGKLMYALLYSIVDDRFDMLSYNGPALIKVMQQIPTSIGSSMVVPIVQHQLQISQLQRNQTIGSSNAKKGKLK